MAVFNDMEQKRLREAVASAERSTSGEIRICVEKRCKVPVLDRAVVYFNKLGMNKTKLRNGVLIYLAMDDRQFAIIGDSRINELVPSDFWDSTKELMLSYFKKGEMLEGIEAGVQKAGEQLKTFFPSVADDVNELSDDISFGDDE